MMNLMRTVRAEHVLLTWELGKISSNIALGRKKKSASEVEPEAEVGFILVLDENTETPEALRHHG